MSDTEARKREPNKAIVSAMQACVEHSRALLTSARAVFEAGHPNIAFHLAVLSLEELGRRELIELQTVTETRPVPPAWVQKHTQAHIKKIFWCFFGSLLFGETVTKERLESLETFARDLHAKRMEGLYVGHEGDNLSIPADAISADQAKGLLDLAAAQLAMAEAEKVRETNSQEELDLQNWFLDTTEDPEKMRAILSNRSLTKLSELKDAKAWGLWLKNEFDRAEVEGRAAIEQELERGKSLPAQGGKDKWKIRIRIFSQSHSIRPKVLNEWNNKVTWIKLLPVPEKKDQLLVELLLKDNVPIEGLWFLGWGLARSFVTALNLGTFGFWWWRFPEDVDRYYEGIEDLERNHKVEVRRNPSLKIDWGKNRVLTDVDLHRVISCMVSMPKPMEQDRQKPYGYYIGGLTMLSLNDVHWQCEVQAFGNFFESIKAMMEACGEWKPATDFVPGLLAFTIDSFPGFSADEKSQLERIFRAFDQRKIDGVQVDLGQVGLMKTLCDLFYNAKMIPFVMKSKKAMSPEAAA